MKTRRAEAKRIYTIREARRKEYIRRLKHGRAAAEAWRRKTRIAAGIPAAKHVASRAAGKKPIHPIRPPTIYQYP